MDHIGLGGLRRTMSDLSDELRSDPKELAFRAAVPDDVSNQVHSAHFELDQELSVYSKCSVKTDGDAVRRAIHQFGRLEYEFLTRAIRHDDQCPVGRPRFFPAFTHTFGVHWSVIGESELLPHML